MKQKLSCFSSLGALFLVFSILFLGSSTGFSNQNDLTALETEGKVYIAPGCVYVAPNGIFININGELLAVDCLFTDAGGVYILANSFGPEARDWKTWICPVCYRPNSYLDSRCRWPDCPTNQRRK